MEIDSMIEKLQVLWKSFEQVEVPNWIMTDLNSQVPPEMEWREHLKIMCVDFHEKGEILFPVTKRYFWDDKFIFEGKLQFVNLNENEDIWMIIKSAG